MKSLYFLIIPILFIVLPSCQKSEPVPVPPVDPREKFLGTWKATDGFTEPDGTIVMQTYTFTIEKSTEDNTLLMQGFANVSGPGFNGVINGNNFEIIVKQISINNMPVLFDALGNIQNEKLTYSYRFMSSTNPRQYSGSAVK